MTGFHVGSQATVLATTLEHICDFHMKLGLFGLLRYVRHKSFCNLHPGVQLRGTDRTIKLLSTDLMYNMSVDACAPRIEYPHLLAGSSSGKGKTGRL